MHFTLHSYQFSQASDHFFSSGSVNVERKEQVKVAAGTAQEWSGWKTSDSSWCEGVWNKKWKELEGGQGIHQEGMK